MDQQRTHGVSS
jgi:hypothetical protein